MAPGSLTLDTTTTWTGTYTGTLFRILATSPEDITTETKPRTLRIRQANPGINDGAYIIINSSGTPERIGLATISCDNTRSFTAVDISDMSEVTYVARKIKNDIVMSLNSIINETGPATPENEAYVGCHSFQRSP